MRFVMNRAVGLLCLFATLVTAQQPAALAESLLSLALVEKGKDPYLYWLFATAAAEMQPGAQRMVAHAVEATSAIVPALTYPILDAAAAKHARREPRWLGALREQVDRHLGQMTETRAGVSSTLAPLAPLPPPLVTTAFSTVIAKWQFPDEDAEVLAKAAAAEFDKFAATQPAGTHPQRLNNDFFDHQTAAVQNGGPQTGALFAHIPAYQRLEGRFRAAAANYLMQHGLDPAEARRRAATRRIDGWVSVHTKGSAHSKHSHVASSVSASFYCRVPHGSGNIRFHDPRGEHKIMKDVMQPQARYSSASGGQSVRNLLPLPPFRRSHSVPVSPGMMVMFPSWLLHEVEESGSTMESGAYRISWAFNMAGDWHETTGHHAIELNATARRNYEEMEDNEGAFGYGAARARDEL